MGLTHTTMHIDSLYPGVSQLLIFYPVQLMQLVVLLLAYRMRNILTRGIGGQAFVIKLRPTEERSPSSMLLEPPYTINDTRVDPTLPPRWRQMK